jgi:GTPase Era involved in 16S rRNA processing
MGKTALSSLGLISDILDGVLTPRLNNDIKELEEKLSGNKFYLVILGLFKRGKSSFINAMLEEQIVPTGVIPLTAIITLIEYGESPSAVIYFEDNKTENVSLDMVADFIAEAKNPNNEKHVAKVVIFSPNPMLKRITLIDTPGVGSSLAHNTEATLRFVNKIDAALFILSTDIPITQLEVDFLKDLKKNVPKVIFILNKSDLLQKEKLEELLSYNLNVLNGICDKRIKIDPVSSLKAEEALANNNSEAFKRSGIPIVREDILNAVESEKDMILKETTGTRIRNIITEGESLLKFKLTSLKMPANELDEKLTEFHKSIKIMKEEKDEFDILMEGKVKRLKEFVSEQVDLLGQTLNRNIYNEIEKRQSEIIAELRKSDLSEFQNKYFEKIKIEFNRLKRQLEKESIEKFRLLLKKYGESSNSFLSEMIKGLTGLMNIKFDSLAEVFDLNIYTGFYYNFAGEAVPIGLNSKTIRSLLPSFLIRSLILKKIRTNFTDKINGNCSSIKFDLSYKIQESFLKFKFDLNNKLESILSSLEKILKETLEEKSKTEEEIKAEVVNLENRIMKLKKLESEYFSR